MEFQGPDRNTNTVRLAGTSIIHIHKNNFLRKHMINYFLFNRNILIQQYLRPCKS